MGLVGSCSETCNCFGGPDVAKPISSSDSRYDSTSSDSDSMSDHSEREPLKPNDKKAKKRKSKKSKKKKRKNERDLSRDESYFSPSDEDEIRKKEERKKEKKKKKNKKKDKKNKDKKGKDGNGIKVVDNENNNNEAGNNLGFYGMDTKTLELFREIDLPVGQKQVQPQPQQAPEPKMPSILSQPIGSIGYNDNNPMNISNVNSNNIIKENVVTPSPSSQAGNDMSLHAQLTNYTSNMMYGGSNTNNTRTPRTPHSNVDQQSEANYDALTVEDEDHNDITPALPQTTNNNNDDNKDDDKNNNNLTINNNKQNELTVKQKKLLGGLDYDFEKDEPSNPLKTDVENVTTDRIMRTFETSQGGDDFEEIVKRTYTHNDMEEETHDDDEDDDDESDASHSTLDSEEKQEIQRRKTEELNAQKKKKEINKQTVSKSKLFRPGTTTPWDNDAMNQTHKAMEEELRALRQNSKEQGNNNPAAHLQAHDMTTTDDDFTTDDDGDGGQVLAKLRFASTAKKPKIPDGDKRQSALFRHKSAYKWDTEEIDKQNQEMQDQLVHLMKTHQGSIEADPTKQTKIMQPMH